MTLKYIEELGDVLCEAISFARNSLGFSSLDKADKVCKAILPDLDHLHEDAAAAAAKAAYDMARRVKDALSS